MVLLRSWSSQGSTMHYHFILVRFRTSSWATCPVEEVLHLWKEILQSSLSCHELLSHSWFFVLMFLTSGFSYTSTQPPCINSGCLSPSNQGHAEQIWRLFSATFVLACSTFLLIYSYFLGHQMEQIFGSKQFFSLFTSIRYDGNLFNHVFSLMLLPRELLQLPSRDVRFYCHSSLCFPPIPIFNQLGQSLSLPLGHPI